MVEDTLREKLLEIMDEKMKVIDGTAARLVKGFYQSCMNIGINLNRWFILSMNCVEREDTMIHDSENVFYY